MRRAGSSADTRDRHWAQDAKDRGVNLLHLIASVQPIAATRGGTEVIPMPVIASVPARKTLPSRPIHLNEVAFVPGEEEMRDAFPLCNVLLRSMAENDEATMSNMKVTRHERILLLRSLLRPHIRTRALAVRRLIVAWEASETPEASIASCATYCADIVAEYLADAASAPALVSEAARRLMSNVETTLANLPVEVTRRTKRPHEEAVATDLAEEWLVKEAQAGSLSHAEGTPYSNDIIRHVLCPLLLQNYDSAIGADIHAMAEAGGRS